MPNLENKAVRKAARKAERKADRKALRPPPTPAAPAANTNPFSAQTLALYAGDKSNPNPFMPTAEMLPKKKK